MTTRKTAEVTELELAVLGLLWRRGPITAYRIRSEFRESPSTYWSASAGAIYPLLRRLESEGLVKGRREERGSRHRRSLTITRAGKGVLRRQLQRVDLPLASAVFDAVRARVFFLEVLSPDERLEFVRSAKRSLEEHERQARDYLETRTAGEDRFALLAARGALLTARARVTWMEEIERYVLDLCSQHADGDLGRRPDGPEGG